MQQASQARPGTLRPISEHYAFIVDEPWTHLNILGFRGSGKTYTAIQYVFLEYLTNPAAVNTTVMYLSQGLGVGKEIIRQVVEAKIAELEDSGFTKKHKLSRHETTGDVTVRYAKHDVRKLILKSYKQRDDLRGLRGDLIVLDEPAAIDEYLFGSVILPALREDVGRALLIGTPTGSTSRTYEELLDEGLPSNRRALLQKIVDGTYDPNIASPWKTKIVTVQDVWPKEKLAKRRAMMLNKEELFQREYMCNYKVICGVGYLHADELAKIPKQINEYVLVDSKYPVFAAWDIGKNCLTVCWVFQHIERQIRFIDYHEGNGVHFSEHLDIIRNKEKENGYDIETMFLPHDAMAETIMSDSSVARACENAGYEIEIIKTTDKSTDIMNAISNIYRCYFNADRCADGLEHLKRYRLRQSLYGGEIVKYIPTPNCEEHYDAADAFRYAIKAVLEYAPGAPKVSQKPFVRDIF
jgi:hypothetical protein